MATSWNGNYLRCYVIVSTFAVENNTSSNTNRMKKMNRLTIALAFMAIASTVKAEDADTLTINNDSVTWNKALNDVSVVASSVNTMGDRTVAFITKEMRRGAQNTAQMLGNIRGLDWNAVDNSIEYHGKKNIIVLVDSIEKGYSYIMNLHHLRFSKVEIIDQPKGKYNGYDALINLTTKKNYEGYEGNVFYNTRLMPSGPNAGKFIWDVETGSITYTRNRWNFVANVSRSADNKTVYQNWFEKSYPMQGLSERTLHVDDTNEETLNNSDYNVNLSVDYQISKNHSLSWSYAYYYSLNQDETNYMLEKTNLGLGTIDTMTVHSFNNTDNHNHSTALFYRGKSGKWSYNADINYVYNCNTPDNTFERGEHFTLRNHYNDHMNYARLRSDARRHWDTNRTQLSFGNISTWKDYERRDFDTDNRLNTNGFFRNNTWFNLWRQIDSIGHNTASIGGSIEEIHVKSNGTSENQVVWSVNAMYWHKLTEKNWIRFNYDCNVSHPNQSQTSTYGYFTDSLTWSGGNPFLRSSVTHNLKVWFDAWWCFNAQAGVTYAPNTISGFSELRHGMLSSGVEGDYVASTFVNTKYVSPWVSVSFTKRFAKNFLYKADAIYTLPRASYGDDVQKGHTFKFWTSLQYYYPKWDFSAKVDYQMYHGKSVTPQTYALSDKDDFLAFTFRKTFCKKHLDVAFVTIAPFKSGSGVNRTYVVSPALTSTNYFCAWPSNNKGCLQLMVTYRFMGGKSIREYNREMSDER